MTTDIKELLPCPFCGSGTKTISAVGEVWVVCVACNTSCGVSTGSVETAHAAWNRRTPIELSAQTAEPVATVNSLDGCTSTKWLVKLPDGFTKLYTHPPVIQTEPDVLAEQFKRAIAGPQSGVSPPKTTGQPNEQNAAIQTEQPSLSDAARTLVDKLDAVHANPEYQSVWFMSANRGAPYAGPQYTEELKILKAAISAQRQDSDKDADK